MKDVKVTELRQNLPSYIARVRKGERVRVTSRGKVVAELGPPASAHEVDAARKRLKGALKRYIKPLEPAFKPEEWDVNK